MNAKSIIIIIVVIAIVLVGGYFLIEGMKSPAPVVQNTTDTTPTNTTPTNTTDENTPDDEDGVGLVITAGQIHNITYTDAGYSPATLNVKVGDTVVWKNQSTQANWVGSAMHPTHVVYSGTTLQDHCPDVENDDFDQCEADSPGDSWSFTFTKAGSWGYHNHMNAKHFGKVVVE